MWTHEALRTGRILVIQHDPDVSQVIVDSLEHEGYEIELIAHARGAVERVGQRTYDTVLLEMRCLDLDGISALHGFGQQDSRLPVVVLTGFYTEDTVQAAFRAGAFAYVLMPYSAAELKRVIRRAVTIRSGLNAFEQCGVDGRTLPQRSGPADHDALVLADGDGTIVFANSRVAEFLPWDEEELLGSHIALAFPNLTPAQFAEVSFVRVMRDEFGFQKFAAFTRSGRTDGSERSLQVLVSRWRTRSGELHAFLIVGGNQEPAWTHDANSNQRETWN